MDVPVRSPDQGWRWQKAYPELIRHFERFHDFVLAPEFTEGLCLFVKNGGNGLDRIRILELLGEWMFG
jgi:hypothetical protein